MSNERFDSVWDAVSSDPVERERLKILSQLLKALQKHIREQGWTQVEAAERLGVSQPRISDVMRGKMSQFSIDALIVLLAAGGVSIELKTKKAA